jgi:RNA polymerase sigma-70 factor (ECF subfamily)
VVDVEALYEKYGPMVLRRCRRLLRDEERSLDAMQETFVRLLGDRERLTDAAPSSLLFRIATNVCLNMLRSERRLSGGDDEVLLEIAAKEDVEEVGLARHLLDSLFGRERPSTRVIAVMRYVDGMTLEETAEAAGLSVSGVRKRLAGLKARGRALEEGRP